MGSVVMNIGINGFEAVVPRFGFRENGLPNRVGSSEYCYQLLNNLQKIDNKNNYIIYLPTKVPADMPAENSRWKYDSFSVKKLWTLLGLGRKLSKNPDNLSVFFSPTHYLPLRVPVPSVISILDVSYHHYPALFNKKDLLQLKLWGRYSIMNAKKIITISQASKGDIIKLYKVNPEKISVVYPSAKPEGEIKKTMTDLKKDFGIRGKYILFVGTLQPRKNVVKLIEAFSKLKEKEIQLLIIGKKGWQYDEILSAPEKFGILDRVVFLHSVTDEDLPSFYSNAQMFVLPSLYEGFGLPVLEAMQYSCPVITSSTSSLPEAGGDAALYVDPKDTADIAEKMQKLLDDTNLREELVKKGKEQVKKFSWENTAKETLRILEEVGNGKN
jgi:glycosyltransferase involved in cell wall biosynthesis